MTGLEPAILAGLSVVQTQKQAKAQSRAMADQARLRLEETEKQREISQRQARDKLRRDTATQRARFGAAGISGSRSADAILANLQRETERRLADENWFLNRDDRAVRNSLSSASRSSLLDL